jgi:hypothetical protein
MPFAELGAAHDWETLSNGGSRFLDTLSLLLAIGLLAWQPTSFLLTPEQISKVRMTEDHSSPMAASI